MDKKDWGIYGDSKREQEQGKRYEKERERTYKGFKIKRDKDGSGFSMMIHKKIKGFEEGTDMSKQEINELGPGTLKSYQKKAVRDLGRLEKQSPSARRR